MAIRLPAPSSATSWTARWASATTSSLPICPAMALPAFLLDTVARTDGRARRLMFEKFAAGTGRNQREIVAGKTPPIAVLNGIDEPFVNTDFVSAVKFSNLWEGKAHLLDKSGHAPFWDSPDRFNPIFARFLASVDKA